MTSMFLPTWRKRIYQLFEYNMQSSALSRHVNGFLVVLIILNVIAVILESDPELGPVYASHFAFFDVFSVVVFTIEFILRLWSCVEAKPDEPSNFKTRIQYLFSGIAIIDLIAIVPFYISLFIALDLRYLRLLRVMRILKLTHYFHGFNIFVTVVTKEIKSIAAAILVMVFLVTIAASVMYTLENHAQPEAFGSIAKSFWWAIVTMTTVGYGDVTPVTFAGKFVAGIIMLLGVGLVALPAGMLAGRFSDELELRRQSLDTHIRQALIDGHIDEREYRALLRLAEKLDLQPEDLRQGIQMMRRDLKIEHCPHCHKRLI